MKNHSIIYWAISSDKSSPGISNKIRDFVESCKDLGYNATSNLKEPGSYYSYIIDIYKLLKSDNTIFIFRYNNLLGLILFFCSIYLRLNNKVVIFDVPTPIKNHLIYNIKNNNRKIKNYIEIINSIVLGPLPFMFTNLVIQYAKEGAFFRILSNHKSILIGNGIRAKSWPQPKNSVNKEKNLINLIAVGAIASWHGWDKVIEAIGDCKKIDPNLVINFKIIGSGEYEKNLKNLVNKLGLDKEILFLGMKSKDQLIDLYAESDIGIGTLAWGNIGVNMASPLKHREYLVNGIPFIYSTDDPDISEKSKFAYKMNPNKEDLINFFLNIKYIKLPKKNECRQYCENNMDFKEKIPKILNLIK